MKVQKDYQSDVAYVIQVGKYYLADPSLYKSLQLEKSIGHACRFFSYGGDNEFERENSREKLVERIQTSITQLEDLGFHDLKIIKIEKVSRVYHSESTVVGEKGKGLKLVDGDEGANTVSYDVSVDDDDGISINHWSDEGKDKGVNN